jgi:predicted GIY-YIG superfamily endonuclease
MYYVYVIECRTPDHYYIGLTQHFDERMGKHMCGTAARFTATHGFKKVISKQGYEWKEDAKDRERELTEQYTQRYGVEKVAGAGWSQVQKGKIQGARLQRRRWKERY